MSKLKWHSGKPPHVGWWHCKDPCSKPWGDWRFWNGRSFGANKSLSDVAYDCAHDISAQGASDER